MKAAAYRCWSAVFNSMMLRPAAGTLSRTGRVIVPSSRTDTVRLRFIAPSSLSSGGRRNLMLRVSPAMSLPNFETGIHGMFCAVSDILQTSRAIAIATMRILMEQRHT